VRFEDATARIGDRAVWSHVDLSITAGDFVAVLGPNGSGKSTLIKAVLGVLPLAAGRVEVLGRPPGESGADIGYLPQRRSFDPSMRVRGVDVVRLGWDGDHWGVPLPWGAARRARNARVDEALVRNPRLLLLDEPLDSLDLSNQGAVAGLIADISRRFGITVLIVAHDVNPIASALDGVVYVARGRAVSGSPDEVITTETLSALYGTPIEVLTTSDGRRVVVGQPDASSHHAGAHGHRHDHP
jgi:zinc/manganese transport system ATP-binding protein